MKKVVKMTSSHFHHSYNYLLLKATEKNNPSNVNAVVSPAILSPAEAFHCIPSYKYREKPKAVAICQPDIRETI
jgi:hypothetical protein